MRFRLLAVLIMNTVTHDVVAQSVYSTKGLKKVSRQKESFCYHMASGASQAIAAHAVGASAEQAIEWMTDPNIKALIQGFAVPQAQTTKFTREKLSMLLFQSYYKAATATEEITALREIGKLQGLYAPEATQLNVHVANTKQLEVQDDATLAQLAGMDDPTVIDMEEEDENERYALAPVVDETDLKERLGTDSPAESGN